MPLYILLHAEIILYSVLSFVKFKIQQVNKVPTGKEICLTFPKYNWNSTSDRALGLSEVLYISTFSCSVLQVQHSSILEDANENLLSKQSSEIQYYFCYLSIDLKPSLKIKLQLKILQQD